MHNFFGKLVRTGLVCGILMTAVPMTSMAAIGPGFKTGTYIATITAESVNINKTKDGEDVLTTAKAGSVFEVLEDLGNGWMKIRVNDTEGYLPVSGNAEVEEAEAGEIEQVQKEAIESSNSYKRQQLVSYALQFVGGPYRYGGSDPHTGTDCSGFTMSLYAKYGHSLPHNAAAQAGCTRKVSSPKPGDLFFYSNGSRINHVAMYIGGGMVIHASNPRDGIKISNAYYRHPAKIGRVMN